MKDKRFKSDFLRFKYINRFLLGQDVLDIGSGEGNMHQLLVKANPDKRFFSLDSKKADFIMDLDNPKKINKKFDSIIVGEVIEHLESPIGFVRFCKTMLKQPGRLIITTPNATGLQYLLNPAWCVHYTKYRGHTQAFTLEMLLRICWDEGLRVIYAGHINAFWIKNPLQYLSLFIKRLRPDLIVVGETS